MAGTIVEARPDRSVEPKAEIGEHRGAAASQPVTPRTIGERRGAEPVADAVAERLHLGALQCFGEIPGVAVAVIHRLVERRRDPGMELGADVAAA
jgi:hypothetical protein